MVSRRRPPFSFIDVFGTKIPEIGRAQITPATPIVIVGTAPRRIHIPSEFGGYGIDVAINNLDTVGTLTYRINSTVGPTSTLSPSGAVALNDIKAVLVQIVTGTSWELTINLVPLPKGI